MKPETMRILAKPMLFAAALIWGASFFVMKDVGTYVPTFFLLAFRFTGGALILGILGWKKWKLLNWDYLWRGLLIGGLMITAFSVMTFGLMGTTPSKNAFLTSVYCVLVPFLNWLVLKRKPDRYNVLAAVLCVAGVGFVSLNEVLGVSWGDGLSLFSAIFYAAHIVGVEKVSKDHDIYLLTVLQFAFAALIAWICGFTFQEFPPVEVFNLSIVIQLGYLIVFATSVALLFQNVGQIWSDPASAAVILSLESVFSVIFCLLLGKETLTMQLALGFAIIFVAVICSETKFSFLRKKKTEVES